MKRVIFMVGGPNRYPLNPNPSVCNSLADYDMGRSASPALSDHHLHPYERYSYSSSIVRPSSRLRLDGCTAPGGSSDEDLENQYLHESPISPMFSKVSDGETFR